MNADGSDGAAVDLLRDRIEKIRPGWTPSTTEQADLRALSTLLDGLPLALELAAARTRSLSVGDIITRLNGRFATLGEVPTGSVAPHRTLAHTIAWSTDLLTPADRVLLDRLWPFEGGFDLELAVDAAGPAEADSVLISLSSLVTKSLVMADTSTNPTRYRLWETVRAYLREQDPEPRANQARHAASVAALVAQTTPVLASPRSSRAMVVLNRELANIRAMLTHDLTADPDRALRSFLALRSFWYRAGPASEGLSWIERLLAAVPDPNRTDRARLLAAKAPLRHAVGDWPQAVATIDALDRALAGLPELALHGQASYFRAVLLTGTHQYEQALVEAGRAITIGARTDDPAGEANGHLAYGLIRLALGEIEAGEAEFQLATRLSSSGTPWTAGMAALYLGRALLDQPDTRLNDAERAVRRAVGVFADEADVGNLTQTLGLLSRLLARRGHHDHAAQVLQTVVSAARRLGIGLLGATPNPDNLQTTGGSSAIQVPDQSEPADPVKALYALADHWRETA